MVSLRSVHFLLACLFAWNVVASAEADSLLESRASVQCVSSDKNIAFLRKNVRQPSMFCNWWLERKRAIAPWSSLSSSTTTNACRCIRSRRSLRTSQMKSVKAPKNRISSAYIAYQFNSPTAFCKFWTISKSRTSGPLDSLLSPRQVYSACSLVLQKKTTTITTKKTSSTKKKTTTSTKKKTTTSTKKTTTTSTKKTTTASTKKSTKSTTKTTSKPKSSSFTSSSSSSSSTTPKTTIVSTSVGTTTLTAVPESTISTQISSLAASTKSILSSSLSLSFSTASTTTKPTSAIVSTSLSSSLVISIIPTSQTTIGQPSMISNSQTTLDTSSNASLQPSSATTFDVETSSTTTSLSSSQTSTGSTTSLEPSSTTTSSTNSSTTSTYLTSFLPTLSSSTFTSQSSSVSLTLSSSSSSLSSSSSSLSSTSSSTSSSASSSSSSSTLSSSSSTTSIPSTTIFSSSSSSSSSSTTTSSTTTLAPLPVRQFAANPRFAFTNNTAEGWSVPDNTYETNRNGWHAINLYAGPPTLILSQNITSVDSDYFYIIHVFYYGRPVSGPTGSFEILVGNQTLYATDVVYSSGTTPALLERAIVFRPSDEMDIAGDGEQDYDFQLIAAGMSPISVEINTAEFWGPFYTQQDADSYAANAWPSAVVIEPSTDGNVTTTIYPVVQSSSSTSTSSSTSSSTSTTMFLSTSTSTTSTTDVSSTSTSTSTTTTASPIPTPDAGPGVIGD